MMGWAIPLSHVGTYATYVPVHEYSKCRAVGRLRAVHDKPYLFIVTCFCSALVHVQRTYARRSSSN